MTPDEGQDGTAARCGRTKDNNAVVTAWRERPYVCDAFVQGEENPFFAPNVFEKNLVWSAGQPLVRNQIRIVPHVAKVIANLSGEILVDLEFHVA